MIHAKMVMSVSVVSVAILACHRAGDSDPVSAGLPGSYVYAAKGSTFKKPWEFAAQLELKRDKTYIFSLDKTVEGHKDSTERANGTYVVSGDHVLLTDPSGGKGATDVHNLLIKADSLIPQVGWTAELFLKGVGAPNIVFVKQGPG
jgi:hypothetical protein